MPALPPFRILCPQVGKPQPGDWGSDENVGFREWCDLGSDWRACPA